MASAVTKKFLPPNEVFDNLPIREQEQLHGFSLFLLVLWVMANLLIYRKLFVETTNNAQSISIGTEELQTKVSSMESLLANIRAAISEIDNNASANEIVASKISGALE